MKLGTVLSIQIAASGTDPLQNLEQVMAVEGLWPRRRPLSQSHRHLLQQA